MTTYLDLKTAVIEDTHRADLTALVPRFIREGEGMIRREMTAFLLSATLTDTERVAASGPIYNLPVGALLIRRIALQGRLGTDITRVALGAINTLHTSNRVAYYSESGTGTVEFSGTPATGAIFDLDYYGMPAELVDDADTNALLDENETLYKAAGMFYLYQHTQDRELASDSLDVFNGVVSTLNEQVARKIGGAKISASYNFGSGSGY